MTEASDILEDLDIRNKPINQLSNKPINDKISQLSNEEMKILELLERENLQFDEIVRKTGISVEKLGSILTVMEMKGFIRNIVTGVYGIK